MNTHKHVIDEGGSMTLYNELGHVVATYDRALEPGMCGFLLRMIEGGQYTSERRAKSPVRQNAA